MSECGAKVKLTFVREQVELGSRRGKEGEEEGEEERFHGKDYFAPRKVGVSTAVSVTCD